MSSATASVRPAGRRPVAVRPRADQTHVASVARRLTPRDRLVCRTLFDHQVLTTEQVTDLCFCNLTTARHRLTTLYELRVLDRFRPFRPVGSDPYHYHYLLDTIGVEVVAADRGIEVPRPGLHHSRALALADSQRLAHLLGVNDLFVRLVAAGRHGPDAELVTWWGERYCKTNLGEVVRPDGVGVWREGDATVTFCLEHDRGTEPLGRISAMGTVDDCYDNSPMESFWGSVQVELLDRQRWRTTLELAVAIADYIEHFYDPARRHSSLGYLTPNEFEDLHSARPTTATLS